MTMAIPSLSLVAVLALAVILYGVALQLKGRDLGGGVAFALFMVLATIEVFDLAALSPSKATYGLKQVTLFLEALLPGLVLGLSISYGRDRLSWSSRWWYPTLLFAGLLFPGTILLFDRVNLFVSPDLAEEKILFLGSVGYWFYIGLVFFFILAMINLEATFSSTQGVARWRLKFELVGLMSLIAVLIFYYSQALLSRTIDMSLTPVRAGVITLAILLSGYSRFFRGSGTRIVVSRYVIYRSLVLLVIGTYLVGLGLVGGGLRFFDVTISHQTLLLIAFLLGTGLFLGLFSDRIRRVVRVRLHKHFYAHKFDYRNEWLRFTERLSSCYTLAEMEKAILGAYIETFGLRKASLFLCDYRGGFFCLALSHGISSGSAALPVATELVDYLARSGRIFRCGDGEYEPSPEEVSFVAGTEARLIVPLIGRNGVTGLVVLGDQLAADEYTYEDFDLMKNLARQSSLAIDNARLLEELAETREIAAIAKVSSFVVHDLKNLSTNLSLVVENAEEYLEDPEFQRDMLGTIRGTLREMKSLVLKLKPVPVAEEAKSRRFDLSELMTDLVKSISANKSSVEFGFNASECRCYGNPESIRSVALNLVINAIDSVHDNGGGVRVETGQCDNMSFFKVADDGCGMAEDFVREHLFRPYATTKKDGLGIGLYQCHQIVKAHNGRIEVQSELGKGSTFTVFIPVAAAPVS